MSGKTGRQIAGETNRYQKKYYENYNTMDRENDTDRKAYRQRDTNTDNKYLHNNYIIING